MKSSVKQILFIGWWIFWVGAMHEVCFAQNNMLQTLEVFTNPPNASVYINEQPVGKTPYSIQLKPGIYRIKVGKAGYFTYVEDLELLEEDKKQVLSLTLKEKPAHLEVQTAQDVRVYINEDLASEGSFDTELEAGTYTLRFEGELYATEVHNVRLLPDQKKTLEVYPEKRFGTLLVKTKPKGATVFLNDKRIGESPLSQEPVRVGMNSVEAVLGGYKLAQKSVLVENTRTTVVKLNLVKTEMPDEVNEGEPQWQSDEEVVKPLSEQQQQRLEKRYEIHNPLSWKYHSVALSGLLAVCGGGVELAYLNKVGAYVMYTTGKPASGSGLAPEKLRSLGGGMLIREGVFGKRNRGNVFLLMGAGIEQGQNGHYYEVGQYVNFGRIVASFGISRMFFDDNPSYFPYNDEMKIRVGLGVSF